MNLGALAWFVPDGGTETLRRWSREATGRLGVGFWPILQTAVAASLAWFLASALLGHERPYFAAIAAVISLGVVVGKEGRRAVELVFGVACGLAVADLVVALIGTGTVQIGVVVALAMALAWLLGGGPALVSEAGVTALITVMLDPTTSGWSPERIVDALVGSGVALGVRAVFPSDPEHRVERAAHTIIDDLTGALRETATALRAGNLELAEHALQRAGEPAGGGGVLGGGLGPGYPPARLPPPRRYALGQLALYATA